MRGVLSVVGASGVGKTTLLVALIECLQARSRRVACLKHSSHALPWDRPGTDSDRLRQAGARPVLLNGGQLLGGSDLGPLELLVPAFAQGAELVLVEGYKHGPFPRLEVVRRAVGSLPLCAPDQLRGLVSDLPLELGVPRFELDDYEALADWLEREFCLGPTDPGQGWLPPGWGRALQAWLEPGRYTFDVS